MRTCSAPLSWVRRVVTEDRADGPVLAAHWSYPEGLLSAEAVRDLAGTWFRALEGLVARAARAGS